MAGGLFVTEYDYYNDKNDTEHGGGGFNWSLDLDAAIEDAIDIVRGTSRLVDVRVKEYDLPDWFELGATDDETTTLVDKLTYGEPSGVMHNMFKMEGGWSFPVETTETMPVYVVHADILQLDGAGGGGFEWWPHYQAAAATAAYVKETELAGISQWLAVDLYLAEMPVSVDCADTWVFDNFEAGIPPVPPILSFKHGSWDEESAA